mgnify:CR=1 FL=1
MYGAVGIVIPVLRSRKCQKKELTRLKLLVYWWVHTILLIIDDGMQLVTEVFSGNRGDS